MFLEAMEIIVTLMMCVGLAVMMVVHVFNFLDNSCSIVDDDHLVKEPIVQVQVHCQCNILLDLEDDSSDCEDSDFDDGNSDDSDVSSSHWGTESNPGIERIWFRTRRAHISQ